MVRFVLVLLMVGAVPSRAEWIGGATFPAQIYEEWWAQLPHSLAPRTCADPDGLPFYERKGSIDGLRLLLTGHYVAAGTDWPFGTADLSRFLTKSLRREPVVDGRKPAADVLYVPMVVGAIVPIYNLPGNPAVNFTRDILANIYLGNITTWDEVDRSLPHEPIKVVGRKDGSGSTYIWAQYLSAAEAWPSSLRPGPEVSWPAKVRRAVGSDGVADKVLGSEFSIGYVEYIYTIRSGTIRNCLLLGRDLTFGSVSNGEGQPIAPDIESIATAAQAAMKQLADSGPILEPEEVQRKIVGIDLKDAYPISAITWIAVPADPGSRGHSKDLMQFLHEALSDSGQQLAKDLFFVPLPVQLLNYGAQPGPLETLSKLGRSARDQPYNSCSVVQGAPICGKPALARRHGRSGMNFPPARLHSCVRRTPAAIQAAPRFSKIVGPGGFWTGSVPRLSQQRIPPKNILLIHLAHFACVPERPIYPWQIASRALVSAVIAAPTPAPIPGIKDRKGMIACSIGLTFL